MSYSINDDSKLRHLKEAWQHIDESDQMVGNEQKHGHTNISDMAGVGGKGTDANPSLKQHQQYDKAHSVRKAYRFFDFVQHCNPNIP